MQLANLPALRQPLDGGLFGGVITLADGITYAIVWLNTVQPPEALDFDGARSWAAGVGGHLVTRAIGTMLVANLGDLLPQTWVWTCEEQNSAFAWLCYLSIGNVNSTGRGAQGGAVAVSMIPLSA